MTIPKLVIETDIFSDVDDVGAIAVAHALADKGLAEIVCVSVNTPSRWGARAVQIVNDFYGRPEIPIGAVLPMNDDVAGKDYAAYLAQTFPEARGAEPVDAVVALRRALAEAGDGEIVVVSLGFLNNLAALLRSAPDEISPLDGVELVRRAVGRTVVMGGLFPEGVEFNIASDAPAAMVFAQEWPVPIEFLGYEIGTDVITGKEVSRLEPTLNPVAAAYREFTGEGQGRKSWDLMAMTLAVLGLNNEYDYSPEGRVAVLEDGATVWTAEAAGPHRYVLRTDSAEAVAQRIEDLLAAAPALGRA